MKKIDIKQDIQTKAIEYGVNVICCYEDGQPHPPLKESDAYKAISEFFQNARYSVKKHNGDKPKLLIKHDGYSTLKIVKNENTNHFAKFGVIFTDDSLEAKIVMNIPVLNKEFRITAMRKNNSNQYFCVQLSYNNDLVYTKPIKRA
jgi:hypothetical protein